MQFRLRNCIGQMQSISPVPYKLGVLHAKPHWMNALRSSTGTPLCCVPYYELKVAPSTVGSKPTANTKSALKRTKPHITATESVSNGFSLADVDFNPRLRTFLLS
jgi:hypothetical protein